jgi:hypothetical protein
MLLRIYVLFHIIILAWLINLVSFLTLPWYCIDFFKVSSTIESSQKNDFQTILLSLSNVREAK